MDLVKWNFTPIASLPMKKYMCLICGHIYDEAVGDPDTASRPARNGRTFRRTGPAPNAARARKTSRWSSSSAGCRCESCTRCCASAISQRSIDFYTDVLGMRVLRTTDRPEQKYTLAFVGYGDESQHAVLELTYNYGVDRYELGNGFRAHRDRGAGRCRGVRGGAREGRHRDARSRSGQGRHDGHRFRTGSRRLQDRADRARRAIDDRRRALLSPFRTRRAGARGCRAHRRPDPGRSSRTRATVPADRR